MGEQRYLDDEEEKIARRNRKALTFSTRYSPTGRTPTLPNRQDVLPRVEPGEGYVIVGLDFASLEMRLVALYRAGDTMSLEKPAERSSPEVAALAKRITEEMRKREEL